MPCGSLFLHLNSQLKHKP